MKWNQLFKTAKKSFWALLLILSTTAIESVFFQNADAASQPTQAAIPCSLATLNGSYGFTNHGFRPDNDSTLSFFQVGRITFDGAGNYSGFHYFQAAPGLLKGPFKGTYQVHSNCTGWLTGEGGRPRSYLVIVHGGDEYYIIPTGKGNVSTGTGKRQ